MSLTQKLIQFKSINPPGNELEIAEYIGGLLAEEGMEVEVLAHSGSRASVMAKVVGGEEPALIYSGHLDVVQAEGNWRHDPFSGHIADGKIWGRGATDMKSGVAAMIAAASAIARARLKLKGPLFLSFTAGEETDNLGAVETLNNYHFGPVRAIFVSEPSDNEIYTAEKGALWLEIWTYGRAAHISRMEDGRNALMMMLPILEALDKMEVPYETHPLLGDYQRSINAIRAGENTNTIPADCVAKVDQRTVPGQNHEALVSRIRDLINEVSQASNLVDFKAELRIITDNPPLEVDAKEPVLAKLFKIAAEINGKAQEEPKGVGYFTDAVKFSPALGAPFAICGPGNPSLNHKADESVEIGRLIDSARIYTMAAAEYLGAG
ncbi:MAG: M20 family metallopeptidase [Deltaproteobacteria bacterium]|nr:M20 family metallopeptidase [Deltaproteobacteria bacterium]